MADEIDELWFDEWEQGGTPYYEDPAAFEKWNPVNYVAQWKTPMQVITGEKDFRIPYTQGLASFTALQRRGIPSRLVVNPNENHWALKPKKSRQWHREGLGGVDEFEQVAGGSDLDHAEEAFGELVVSGGDGAIDFEMTKHALDTIALLVEGAVVDDRLLTVGSSWDDGVDPAAT